MTSGSSNSNGGGLYWVRDASERVLGPLTLATMTELVNAGRLRDITGISRDGSQWSAPETLPAVAKLFRPPDVIAREREEVLKADQLRQQLQQLRSKRPHEVLGVREKATLEEYRTAFFALAKRFHPARLPAGTNIKLREACFETFQMLSKLMEALEIAMTPPSPPKPTVIAPLKPVAAAPAKPAVPPVRRYEANDFVGLTKDGAGFEATVRMNPLTQSIFTEHHTVNFKNESVFLPVPYHLPLGTLLEINLIFENTRQIRSRARVVWENVSEASKAKPGLGVRLLSLGKGDKQFILDYLHTISAEKAASEEPASSKDSDDFW